MGGHCLVIIKTVSITKVGLKEDIDNHLEVFNKEQRFFF